MPENGASVNGPRPSAEVARAELEQLRSTQLWAFAHGHGCTIGDAPEFRAVRARDAHLRAIIAEHEEAQ